MLLNKQRDMSQNPFEILEQKMQSGFAEIKELILSQKLSETSEQAEESKYLYSLRALSDFIGCSVVTAQKLKNRGTIPYYQVGRKLVFEKEAVRQAMKPCYRFKKAKGGKDGQ